MFIHCIHRKCAIFLFPVYLTLNMCHMLPSKLGWFSLSLMSVNLYRSSWLIMTRYVTLWPWPLTLNVYRLSRDQTLYQAERNSRRGYCDLNMSHLGAVRHLGFDRKWFFTHQRTTFLPRISTNLAMRRWVISDSIQHIFQAFTRRNRSPISPEMAHAPNYYRPYTKFCENTDQRSALPSLF